MYFLVSGFLAFLMYSLMASLISSDLVTPSLEAVLSSSFSKSSYILKVTTFKVLPSIIPNQKRNNKFLLFVFFGPRLRVKN